jgi:hypothetical protein
MIDMIRAITLGNSFLGRLNCLVRARFEHAAMSEPCRFYRVVRYFTPLCATSRRNASTKVSINFDRGWRLGYSSHMLKLTVG